MKSLAVGLVVLLLIGCQNSTSRSVYVDLKLVPEITGKPLPDAGVSSIETAAFDAKKSDIEPMPPRVVAISQSQTREGIVKLLRAEAEKSRSLIAEQLKEYYKTELEDSLDKLRGELGPTKLKLWAEYDSQIRPIFEKYASARAPLVIEVEILNFDIPAGVALPTDPKTDPGVIANEQKLKDVLAKLAALDQEYNDIMRSMEREVGAQTAKADRDLLVRGEKKRQEINERAELEAKDLVRQRTADLSEKLFQNTTQTLAKTEGESLSIEGQPASTLVKQVPSSKRNLSPRADVHRQLQIWLELNRYQLAESKATGEDLTIEFVKWRAAHTSTH